MTTTDGMLFSELDRAASGLVRQLLHTKRCFGSRSAIGIVTRGTEFDLCGTVAELVARGHAPGGLEWMDPFLAAIPTVYEIPASDFTVVPSRRRAALPLGYGEARAGGGAGQGRHGQAGRGTEGPMRTGTMVDGVGSCRATRRDKG